MLSSIASFSGLASGIQWRDLIDQMMALEAAPIDRLQERIDGARLRTAAWSDFTTRVANLRDASKNAAANALRANKVALSGSGIASAAVTPDASAGTHTVRVLSLATAESLGGDVVASRTDALGVAGELRVNGQRVEILATDSLNDVARRFNEANAGGALGVTASVLTTAAGHRLILNSTSTGEAGIDLADGAGGVLRSLGLLTDDVSIKHITTSGARSDVFADATSTVSDLLGLTTPPAAGNVDLGGVAVTLDLATMSLADVAAAINTASTLAGRGITATVVEDGEGRRLDIRGTTSFTDANRVLESLGVVEGGRGAVAHQIGSGVLGAAGATPASAGTLLSDLWSGGAAAAVQAGDTLTLRGTRGDGTTFDLTYTVAGGDTVQTVLDRLNSAVDAFGAGARPAVASVSADGRITVTDGTGGDSRLGLTIIAHNENGGTLDFGEFAATTVGRARQIRAGADAAVEIDGSFLSSAGNTITSAVPGLTLRLGAADPNALSTVTVARDVDAGVAAIQKVVDAYNSLAEFVDGQLAPPADGASPKPLHSDSVLRSMRSTLRTSLNAILDGGTTGGPARLADIGIEIDRAGRYTVDAEKLRSSVENSGEAVARLMGVFGSTTGAGLSYVASTDASRDGQYAVQITQAAAAAAITGAGFGGVYSDDIEPDWLTIRDTATNRAYSIALIDGMTTAQIVNAINSELAKPQTHRIETGSALSADAGGTPADDATALADVHIGGAATGITAGDTLTISGSRTDGSAFLASLVVPVGGTLADLRTAAQQAVGADVALSWQAGRLVAETEAAGSSTFTLSITSDNAGGGTLDFGGFTVTQQGRGTSNITASDDGGQLRLAHADYGSAAGFEVSFAAGGSDATASLGLAAGTFAGADLAGTIGGFAATGTGRILAGSAGSAVEGITLRYDGAATGDIGALTFSRGIGSRVTLAADALLGSGGGSIQSVIERIDGSIARWDNRILTLEGRLEMRREQLIRRFTALEAVMAQAQSQSAWLDSQVRQFASSSGNS